MIEYDAEPLRMSGSKIAESCIDITEKFESAPPTPITDESTAGEAERASLIADGGETIEEYSALQNSDKEVLRASTDGTLFAYRDGDEHVVVARGNPPGGEWEKRVPAIRTAVANGESLWTIPDNWIPKIYINDTVEEDYCVFTIPESGDDVLASIPNKCRLADATYDIKGIGKFNAETEYNLDRSVLQDTIAACETHADIPAEITNALQTIDEHWETFALRLSVKTDRGESKSSEQMERDHNNVEPDWVAPGSWEETFGLSEIVMEVCDVDKDLAAEVSELLIETNVLSARTEVKGSIHDQ